MEYISEFQVLNVDTKKTFIYIDLEDSMVNALGNLIKPSASMVERVLYSVITQIYIRLRIQNFVNEIAIGVVIRCKHQLNLSYMCDKRFNK